MECAITENAVIQYKFLKLRQQHICCCSNVETQEQQQQQQESCRVLFPLSTAETAGFSNPPFSETSSSQGGKKHTHTFMSAFNIHSFSLLIKLHSKLLDVSTNKKEKTTTHLLQASRISFSSTGESTITIASVLSPIIEQASILLPIRLFLSDYLKKIYKSLLISDRVN